MDSGRRTTRESDAPQHFREQTGDHGEAIPEDSTPASHGRMNLADEDAGSDPYNRTGRFRRLVR